MTDEFEANHEMNLQDPWEVHLSIAVLRAQNVYSRISLAHLRIPIKGI